MVAVVLTSTLTSAWTASLNPGDSTATRYLPGFRPLKEYVPALLDTVWLATDVSSLVTVTFAFETTALLGSVMVPVMPALACARALCGAQSTTHAIAKPMTRAIRGTGIDRRRLRFS